MIYPVIVTYDRMGTDNPGFTRWFEGRCNVDKLLRGCKPAIVIQIDDFEELMAVVARGRSLTKILRQKLGGDDRHTRLATFLRKHVVRDVSELRLPDAESGFDELTARIEARLFGVTRREEVPGSTLEPAG